MAPRQSLVNERTHTCWKISENGEPDPESTVDLFATIRILIDTLIEALTNESPLNNLWIVEPGRVKIHERQ